MRGLGLLGGSLLALTVAVSPAAAANLVYTVTGNGQVVVNGSLYTGNYTITAIGDPASLLHPAVAPTANVIVLSSITGAFGPNVVTGLEPTVFFTNPPVNFNGFNSVHPGAPSGLLNLLNFTFATPTAYNGTTPFGPVPINFAFSGTAPGPNSYATDAGPLFFFQRQQLGTFSAAWQDVKGGVPEPATWAMMAAGMLAIGAAKRRRVTVRYA